MADASEKPLKYPKAIFFIISTEFCERFHFYGMRTILVIYYTTKLEYSDHGATSLYHTFFSMLYFMTIFGAIISDSWLGKFKTIFYLSIVYMCGSALNGIGAIGPLHLPAEIMSILGLSLVIVGSGGIKPCVVSFGGDQFKLPEQTKQNETYFLIFYFSINAGSFISTFLTPILRHDVQCFGELDCFPLAFGFPAILLFAAIIIFVSGKSFYIITEPKGNMVVLVSKCIGYAIVTKIKEYKTNPKEHWLDYSEPKYGQQLVSDCKCFLNVIKLYIPLPLFFALFDQQGSRWVLQGTRMNGLIGEYVIKPEQLQVLNPFFIMCLLPLYEYVFYPLLAKLGIRRPLQKLTFGGILAGVAFFISGILELNLQKTYPVLTEPGFAQIRFFNTMQCGYTFDVPEISQINKKVIKSMQMFTEKYVKVDGTKSFKYTLVSDNPTLCPNSDGNIDLTDNAAWSFFVKSTSSAIQLEKIEDNPNKPSKEKTSVRFIANMQKDRKITLTDNGGETVISIKSSDLELHILIPGEHQLNIDDVKVKNFNFRNGGVYALFINEKSDNSYVTEVHVITIPNQLHLLWLVPQYIIMALAEVLFSVTGLQFSYTQAPVSMKSVLAACWTLNSAIGNLIMAIIAKSQLMKNQAAEFFMFGILMIVDMVCFAFLAMRYKYVDPKNATD